MPEQTGERTESATPKRRQDARNRGQVARSQELSSALVFLGVIVVLRAVGPAGFNGLVDGIRRMIDQMTFADPSLFGLDRAMELFWGWAWLLLRVVGPPILAAAAVGILANVAQTGPLFAGQALAPDFKRLNPMTGLARIFSTRGLVELVKALAKVAIIGTIAWRTLSSELPTLLLAVGPDPRTLLAQWGHAADRLAINIGAAILVLAIFDYFYQRFEFEKSIKMTKQEVKRESKEQDGDPLLKSRLRARQREMARRRMMQEVPSATVVVTNPTHYAVALRYDREAMAAPRVVAKGTGEIARRIREVADEHGIPRVENPPLARSLYAQVGLEEEVPGSLYAAVAEVLAFVYRLDEERKRK